MTNEDLINNFTGWVKVNVPNMEKDARLGVGLGEYLHNVVVFAVELERKWLYMKNKIENNSRSSRKPSVRKPKIKEEIKPKKKGRPPARK